MADDMPPAVDDDLQELINELMEDEAEDREHEEISAKALSEATEYLEDPDPPSPEQLAGFFQKNKKNLRPVGGG
uniref:Uncharacterized protein n=1 Tax=Oryza meridionalis TaxID=40149 RepID=A0A0E0E9W5_9ORYZ